MKRAYLYGDLVFETILIEHGKPVFITHHFNRLKNACNQLYFETDWLQFDAFSHEIQSICTSLLADRLYRLRYTVFRKAHGLYTPDSNETKHQIEFQEIEPIIPNEHSRLGVFSEHQKACTPLSNIKSGNALVSVLAGLYAQRNQLDDVIVLNNFGRIAETIASNVFFIKNGRLFTPALSEGCVAGVYREVFIEQLFKRGIEIETGAYTLDFLSDVDEIFTTNCIRGIQSYNSFEGKTLQHVLTGHFRHIMAESGI